MNVKEYLLHLNQVKEDRIRLRVWILICLKRINDKRISDSEDVIMKRMLNDGGSSGSSNGISNSDIELSNDVIEGLTDQMKQGIIILKRRNEDLSREIGCLGRDYRILDGVLAEKKITANELWREIALFL